MTYEGLRQRFDEKPPAERRRWVLWTLMLGSMVALLDATIVNVSIPSMMRDFNASVSDVQWVISAYMIAFAVLMPLTSWVRVQIGSRKLYVGSLLIFTLGSLLCGLAWDLPSLIGFRILQALGGGALTPIAMAIISETFPAGEKGKALGIWGSGVLIGPVLGPPLGGFLTEFAGWRSIFLVNLPLGIVGIMAAVLILRRDRPRGPVAWRTFNFVGFTLLSGFLISLLYGASIIEHDGIGSPVVFGCGLLSIIFLITYLISEMRSKRPILDFSVFQSRTFSIAIAISLVRSFALYGGQFLLPLFLARVQGYSDYQIGLLILPGALLIGAIFPFSGRGSDRWGAKPFVIAGLLLLVGFFLQLSFVTAQTTYLGMLIPIMIRGVGLGLMITPITSAALGAIPNEKSADGSVILNLAQQLGGSLGIASLGSVLEYQSRSHVADGIQAGQALVLSFQDAFRLGVVVCGLSLLLALAFPKGQDRNRHGPT